MINGNLSNNTALNQILEQAAQQAELDAAILINLNNPRIGGFSLQMPQDDLKLLPLKLRQLATHIECQFNKSDLSL
ncbi:hypothetical protein J7384_17145 [Endozoicomonas sp. G2_1]|uniref:hypothetical protein n=1 Tax=Endozoicomonas sp. G2_1 TaxID=2821091 RepID=UPI001ADA6E8F|nr:hypothetical protein [Endozoicomonas sp. G2_1]MBO9492091.1 hypothetical protein [Endozoicomonas sp. G2_1]